MDVFRAHPIARLEFRGRGRRAAELAAHHDALDLIDGELAVLERLCRRQRMRGGDFLWRDIALGEQVLLEPEEPFPVVGTGHVDLGRQRLAIVARGVDVEGAGRAHRAHHRQHAAFPFGVEHRLVRLGLDLAEAVHAAHVVHAVHDGAPGVLGKPVPIMELRDDAAGRDAAPDRATLDDFATQVGAGAGSRRGGQAESRNHRPASPEPHRICQRHSRSARSRYRCPRTCFRRTIRAKASTISRMLWPSRRRWWNATWPQPPKSAGWPSAILARRRHGHLSGAGRLSQSEHIEGLPLGTRGGILVRNIFPLDAEYAIKIRAKAATSGWVRPASSTRTGSDAQRRARQTGEGGYHSGFAPPGESRAARPRRRVHEQESAGSRRYLADLSEQFRRAERRDHRTAESTGAGDTPSRRRIFVCRPASA